ncbi:MAG: hypothetical protein MUD14_14905 [Hydrococcus sp. Prado102]|jgi:hypothetical protein|nr:hypothetical protein [Hydrococcus sp. Prado102]
MNCKINCPACRGRLYLPFRQNDDEDVQDIICSRCLGRYAVTYLEIINSTFDLETLSSSHPERATQYRRVYRVRAFNSKREIEFLEFSLPSSAHSFSLSSGDELILLNTIQDNAIDKLIWLKNHTTGESYQFFSPSSQAKIIGLKAGMFVMGVSLLLAYLLPLSPKQLLAIALPTSAGVGVCVAQRQSRQGKERNARVATRLKAEQMLLKNLDSVNERLQQHQQNFIAERRTRDRLRQLHEKMSQTDTAQFESRLLVLDRGIAVLKEQLALNQNLIDGYSQVKNLLEIEYETSRLAEQLPNAEDFGAKIFARLEELNALERQKEALALDREPAKLYCE